MAFDEGITDQFGDRLPGEFGTVKSFPKNLFARLGRPDITAHADSLIDDITHPGLKTDAGQDTLGGSVAHLNRGHNKVRLFIKFPAFHTWSANDSRRRGALDDMWFW